MEEYFLITVLQLIGIGLCVWFKLLELDNLSHEDTLLDIWNLFWYKDRVTIFISLTGLVLHLVVHYILEKYSTLPQTPNYILWVFGLALIMGYGGQGLLYAILGKSTKFIQNKIENKLN